MAVVTVDRSGARPCSVRGGLKTAAWRAATPARPLPARQAFDDFVGRVPRRPRHKLSKTRSTGA